MPIVPIPSFSSKCTYSWLFAYLLSSGVLIGASPLLSALVERGGDDARPSLFASDQDHELGAGRRFVERKICESDRFFQCRRMRAAGDDADLLAAVDDRVSVPGDAAVDHLESDQFPARSLDLFALQHVAAVEVSLFELHDPAEVRLERRGGVIDVVAVERHLRFETQRVARAEAARFRAELDQLLHQRSEE